MAHRSTDDAATWSHVKKAADFLVNFTQEGQRAPWTPQERWENQGGFSPATIAAEIAGLEAAAEIAEANGDGESAALYRDTAASWRDQVDTWTLTPNGPYSAEPYYLRLSKDGDASAGTTYSVGDGGPSAIDQREVVDMSFLALVRFGIKDPLDPPFLSTAGGDDTRWPTRPTGKFGAATTSTLRRDARGPPWDISDRNRRHDRLRAWPIPAGAR